MGSKARFSKEILPIILKERTADQWYIEPFAGNVEHIRRQGFETQMLVYFRKFNRNTKAESLHFCPAFVYALLAVVLFVKRNNFKNEYQLSSNKNH